MQFVEKSAYAVRSAVYHLKKDGSGLELLLFPMIHIGSQDFYDQIRDRLSGCDLILAEGVASRKVQYLTYSYRVVKRIKRMELVTQGDALKMADFRPKMINADMGGREFDRRWSQLPLSLRLVIIFGLPVYVAHLLVKGTKESLAAQMALDDLPSQEEELMYDEGEEAFDSLMVADRDQKLISQIKEIAQDGIEGKKLVGIVYGAAHMRGVMRFLLHKLEYRVESAEWVTVFDL